MGAIERWSMPKNSLSSDRLLAYNDVTGKHKFYEATI